MSKEVSFVVASNVHCAELAILNKQLNDSGGCNNDMSVPELKNRMQEFLTSGYKAIIFEADGIHIGYTLVALNKSPIFVRHFFIIDKFRRQGYGTAAFNKLVEFLEVDKIDLSVLVSNEIGLKFWMSCGLKPYEEFLHYRREINSTK